MSEINWTNFDSDLKERQEKIQKGWFNINPFDAIISKLNFDFSKGILNEFRYDNLVHKLDNIMKARQVKYLRREGSPGSYRYIYDEPNPKSFKISGPDKEGWSKVTYHKDKERVEPEKKEKIKEKEIPETIKKEPEKPKEQPKQEPKTEFKKEPVKEVEKPKEEIEKPKETKKPEPIKKIENDRPASDTKKRFTEVKEISRTEITTAPELFQGRQHAYSEESVNKIVSEGFDKTNDPIVVWYDKDKEKYVVISGHSRWEASTRLYEGGDKSLKEMPVKEFIGDKHEAVNYAVLESNRASTSEGFASDVKAVKKMMTEGFNRVEMSKYIKPKSYLDKVMNYTYLNPEGKFMEFMGSDSKVSFPYLERNAEWVGTLRKIYKDKLTDIHESEIFDYLYKSDKKGLSIKKDEFFNLIDKKVNKLDFNSKQPLNLKNVVSTNSLTSDAQVILKEYEGNVIEMAREISRKQDLIVRAKATGKDDLIDKFQTDIRNLSTKIIDTKTKIDKLKSSIAKVENQTVKDLFS